MVLLLLQLEACGEEQPELERLCPPTKTHRRWAGGVGGMVQGQEVGAEQEKSKTLKTVLRD